MIATQSASAPAGATSAAITAFNQSPSTMLSMKSFMPFSGVDLEPAFMDRFFHNLRNDMKIYITKADIEYMGFENNIKSQKSHFIRVLENPENMFTEGTDYWIYGNEEYKSYYDKVSTYLESDILSTFKGEQNCTFKKDQVSITELNYPDPFKFKANGKGRQKHIILTVRCFKELLMIISTPKAKQIRRYYLDLEDFMKAYDSYQIYFNQHAISKLDALLIETKAGREEAEKGRQEAIKNHQESMEAQKVLLQELQKSREENKKILTKLDDTQEEFVEFREDAEVQHEEIISQLNTIANDRVIQPDKKIKKECFILFRLNDPATKYTHKVVRAKYEAPTRGIVNLKAKYKKAEEVYRVDAAPNAKTFYENIRENIPETYRANYIKLTRSESEFISDIHELYESRKNV